MADRLGRSDRPMRPSRATLAAVAVSLLACLTVGASSCDPGPSGPGGTTTTKPGTPPGPPKVTLIGDSMAREARADITAQAKSAGLALTTDLRGQAAPCSQEKAVLDALAKRPRVVAVEWIGNARFTAGCTTAFEVEEVVAEYRASLLRIIAHRPAGTTIALVGIPPIQQVPWDKTWKPLDDLYRKVAADTTGVGYVDVNPTIAPGRRFVRTLPCNDTERADGRCGTQGAPAGQVVVRDPEGFHFCPVTYELSTANCPVPSPGAARYAKAIVDGLRGFAT